MIHVDLYHSNVIHHTSIFMHYTILIEINRIWNKNGPDTPINGVKSSKRGVNKITVKIVPGGVPLCVKSEVIYR